MLTLSLQKPDAAPVRRLTLSLSKGARFSVKVEWDCKADHQDDVDVHALEAVNSGHGAKVTALEGILSTYNTTRMSRTGALKTNPDGSFATPSGGLSHSGDIRVQGSQAEVLTVDGSKVPPAVNEIPLFATVHKADHGEGHEDEHDDDDEAAFADIDICVVTISDDSGRVLGKYQLSDEFGEFNVVQLGTVMLAPSGGWEYVPVGVGFKGDFNDVLGHFC
ncbi:TerD family protein [Ideonella sp.]|uniref:TerD family protein n=1 Tax=Ideonella sp. TaxID=1929293 RepID=UPI0035ADC175